MKRTILLTISILLILSACSSPKPIPTATATASITASPTQEFITSTPKPTNTPTLVETAESWDEIKPFLKYPLLNFLDTISPNGQWIVAEKGIIPWEPKYNSTPVNSNKLFSVEDSNQFLNIEYSLPNSSSESYHYFFDSWSPDGKSIIGMYYDLCSGIAFRCGRAVAITNIKDNKVDSHLFQWGSGEEPNIYWSDDSSKIGLAFRENGFWIIDRNGNLINEIELNNILSTLWVKDTLFALADSGNNYLLYKINLKENSQKILYTSEVFFEFVGYDGDLNQLLLIYRQFRRLDGIDKGGLWFFDLASETIISKIEMPQVLSSWKTSPSRRYVALVGSEKRLIIFDWKLHTTKYYGDIYTLIGWFNNKDGFVVEATNKDIKIIRPQE
jgi:hypothetical protein